MGLISYNGKTREIVFRCSGCKDKEQSPERTVSEADIELALGGGFAGLMLPLCTCHARSYILPGKELKGPVSHMRAVLFKRRYDAARGDSNLDLAPYKEYVDALRASYAEVGTQEAAEQFEGSCSVNLDKTIKPLKSSVKPE